ncbi:sporulation sigma-E factor-processing peptidase [Moorella thermoacetica]|uniref:Sporulation sigma-E factor-processing peptidase n=1 Tax=Neomoorella thermoacetica TaxID=1525 RepID=A0A1J5P1S3_NEOTH|nr:sporulation sigma-E factor-processing peptidase [Moorella thermoacetica]
MDVVLVINLVMDYFILWATARLGQLPVSSWRLLAGAAVGAAYSLALLFPGQELVLTLVVKVLFSLVMLLAAFYPLSWRRFFQAVVYFYLVAFTMGGAMLGGIYLAGCGESLQFMGGAVMAAPGLHYTWLLVALAAAMVLVRWGAGWLKKNIWQQMLRLPVVITFGGRHLAVKALVDTGNSLREPLSQRPVIIVEYNALKEIIPPEIIKAYDSQGGFDLDYLVNSLAATPWATRLRLIPYHSLGQERGMLLGLRPDEVVIVTSGGMIKVKEVLIGLYREQLSPEGNYRALLHPDLLELSMSF